MRSSTARVWLYEAVEEGEKENAPSEGVRFHDATDFTRADVEALQETVRRRLHRWFRRQGLLEEHMVHELLRWNHGAPCGAWSRFSLDASVHIAAHDRAGLERLLRGHPPHVDRARPPFALNRLNWQDSGGSNGEGVLLCRLSRPTSDGRTLIRLSPLEFLDRLAARPACGGCRIILRLICYS